MKKATVWFKNLSRIAQVSVLSSVALGGLFITSAMSPTPDNNPAPSTPITQVEEKKESVVTTKVETETHSIEFQKVTIEDNSLAKGLNAIRTNGINGIKTITHTITLTDGIETDRKTTEANTIEPVTEVTAIGTYVAPVIVPRASSCDSNYSGCVPIASDVDCAGGSGNGPAYAYGPISVIGYDIYDLDRDGDGIACE